MSASLRFFLPSAFLIQGMGSLLLDRVLKIFWFTLILRATGTAAFAQQLDIYKFDEVRNGREAPANLVYLKADQTEGQKTDAGVVGAMKIILTELPRTNLTGIELMAQVDHLVMPKTGVNIGANHGLISVDVWASPNFQRASNKNPGAQVDPGDFNGYVQTVPNMDFWITSSHHMFFAELQRGKWTHVESKFIEPIPLEFHVPPGAGFVYLKNLTVKP